MHFTFWFSLYFQLVAQATNTTTDNPSILPVPVALSLYSTFPACSTTQIESGIHPCVNRVDYAFLAIQGHIRRVTHCFKHVSPWPLLCVTNVLMLHALRGDAVVLGSSSMMILILRSYLNHVSRPLRAYLFTCPWATPRILFFTLCIGLLMFPRPIALSISIPLLRVLLYYVVKI